MIQIKTMSQSLGKSLLNSAFTPPRLNIPSWTWNGQAVSITEFANLAYGDTPQRTLFLLKYGESK